MNIPPNFLFSENQTQLANGLCINVYFWKNVLMWLFVLANKSVQSYKKINKTI